MPTTPPKPKPKPSRQVKRAATRRAAKSAAQTNPPEVVNPPDAPEDAGTVDLDAPTPDQPNAVVLTRDFDPDGKIAVNVVTLGDVRASEVEYIIKKGLKAIAEADI